MNPPAPSDLATDHATAESARTLYLKSGGPRPLLAAVTRLALRHPVGLAGLVVAAVRSARLDGGIAVRRLVHLAYAARVVEHCRANRITHLHAHFGLAPATIAWFAARLGRLADERWTWSFTIHGFQDFVAESDSRLDLKVADASFVVCISDFTRSQLCRVSPTRYWDRAHVVRCGLPLHEIASREPVAPRTPATIVVVARLSAEKGHTVLLRALRSLHERGLTARLEVIGDGPDRERVTEERERLGLTEFVDLVGELPPEQVEERLREADVFCLPSFSEGLPVSIMEAMAVGVPVVATGISGVPELAVNDVSALTVPPGNVDALTDALARILDEPGLAERLAVAGRAAVERDHDLDHNVDRLVELFRATSAEPVG